MNQLATEQNTNLINIDEGPSKWLNNPQINTRIENALAGWLKSDEFIAQIIIAFQDEKIAACSNASKFSAAHECAVLQLLPTLSQVAFIPRNNKKRGADGNEYYENECTVMPQWQGYKSIMERHPDVLDVTGYLIHKDDSYSYANGVINHVCDPFDDSREFKSEKDLKGGFLVVQFRDGRPEKHFPVPKSYIEKCRKCAQTQSIWGPWYEQMALKTVYRAGYSRRIVPIDPLVNRKLEKLIKAEDYSMGNDPSRVLDPAPKLSNNDLNELQASWANKQKKPVEPQQQAAPPMPRPTEQPAKKTTKKKASKPEPEDMSQESEPSDRELEAMFTAYKKTVRNLKNSDDINQCADEFAESFAVDSDEYNRVRKIADDAIEVLG